MSQSDVRPWESSVIETQGELRKIYKQPSVGAVGKVLSRIDRHYRRFIELSPFFCLGTMSADGRGDVSPRGGEAGFVHVLEPTLLAIPDRPGNNRIDSLCNLIERPGVAMLFFVPGFEDTLRVNGLARITVDDALRHRFVANEKLPLSVLIVEVKEAYIHCGKAIRRSHLWNQERHVDRNTYPTVGQIFRDQFRLEQEASSLDEVFEKDGRENLY